MSLTWILMIEKVVLDEDSRFSRQRAACIAVVLFHLIQETNDFSLKD